jgi:hypothetical protein
MTLYSDFSRETTGHSWERLDKLMSFLAARLAASDYTRARELLHAAVNPAVAARLAESDAAAEQAATLEAASRAQRKGRR